MRTILHENTRLGLAADSLAGLSVGDALGAQHFMVGRKVGDLLAGKVPPPVWEWTDDTEMACSVVWMLQEAGEIDQDRLAMAFAERCEPNRGYGMGAFIITRKIREGVPWRVAAAEAFDGQGSCGNGAAMRVAPLGAYYADSPARAAVQAAKSAEPTHLHREGVAGAVAVAVAASVAALYRLRGVRPTPGKFLDECRDRVPPGQVHSGLGRARRMLSASLEEAVYQLGNGSGVTAQDTVPFTLWVAARHLDDYPAAIKECVAAGGDADTTSAIAGGIVGAFVGTQGIPSDWLAAREPLPSWVGSA